MTLIAAWKYRNTVVMVGDILKSAENPVTNTFRLPGSGNDPVQTRYGTYATGLVQKLVKIDDHLFIAWSGLQIMARGLIRELRKERLTPNLSNWEAIENFLTQWAEGWDDNEIAQFACIAAYVTPNSAHLWSINTRIIRDRKEVEELHVAGTGTDTFTNAIFNFSPGSHLNAPVGGALWGLECVASLWSMDVTDEHSIGLAFGGGYEAAATIDGRIEKLVDMALHHLVVAIVVDGISFGLNRTIAKLNYIRDFLFLWIFQYQRLGEDIGSPGEESLQLIPERSWVFFVPPPDKTHDPIGRNPPIRTHPNFSAYFTGVGFHITKEGHVIGRGAVPICDPTLSTLVEVTEGWQIRYSQKLLAEIEGVVRKASSVTLTVR